jgi:hypothetical protein
MFNELDLWTLAQQGTLRQKVIYEGKPRAGTKFPKGTKSQVIRYYDPTTGRQVAIVHQYSLPDGSIGASGKPDPKRVVKDGVVYTCLTAGIS